VDVDDPAAVHQLAQRLHDTVAAALGAAQHRLETDQQTLDRQRDELTVELDRLRGGGIDHPPAPAGRRDRDRLAGAPLWELVAFTDDVDDAQAARIEAALTGAGLLDAWVTPDGQVTLDGPDTVLTSSCEPATGTDLRQVLRTEEHPQVPAGHVDALLARIGWADTALSGEVPAPVTIAADGSWRAGPAHGLTATDGPARYLGATTREQRRLTRIAQLETELADLDTALADLARQLTALTDRRETARTERAGAAVPAQTTLADARETQRQAFYAREHAADTLAAAEAELATSEQQFRTAQRTLHARASEYGLPTTDAGLNANEEACSQIERQAATVATRAERLRGVTVTASDTGEAATEAETGADAAEGHAAETKRVAEREQARYDQLERTSGADARQVLADIAAVETHQQQLRTEEGAARKRQRHVDGEVATARSTQAHATEARERAEARRDEAHDAFVRIAAAGLVTDAGLDLATDLATVTATKEAAQSVRAKVGTRARTPFAVKTALSRLEEQVYQASGQLSGRADLTVVADETGTFSVLTARVDGTPLRAPVLQDTFEVRLAQAERELSDQEEKVFEETLTGAVRDHLAARIRQANSTVKRINRLLDDIRTDAGGVKVQLRWDVDGHEIDDKVVLDRIKTLLLGSRHDTTEQAELHTFLRRQVDKVRSAEDDTGNWQDRLARVLDYRRWHRFTVLVHHDRFGDRPVPFGSRKVTLSAGEKTVALTVPLIAAIAAHYLPRDGEDAPTCPRLLLMDELFPKVDRTNKRKLLGLINDLGLDVVFTSDKDWCDYDTLDTIAIHVVQKDGDASLTTRFVWNGRQRTPAAVAAHPDRPRGLFDEDLP
jgi:uncharacterized protein (TIGR02680 family)